jgi:hypothetical protein
MPADPFPETSKMLAIYGTMVLVMVPYHGTKDHTLLQQDFKRKKNCHGTIPLYQGSYFISTFMCQLVHKMCQLVHKMCQLVHKMCQLVDDQLVYMPAGRQNYLLMYQLVKCASWQLEQIFPVASTKMSKFG